MDYIVIGLIIVGLVGVDQITKVWATNTLADGRSIPIWDGVFHLQYVKNTGAAFGMLGGRQTFLIIITTLIIIGMFIYYHKLPTTVLGKWTKIAFIMIISGAIGNLIDRVFLNYVRDFLYFKLINFPVFNVADILVVVGVGLLVVTMLLSEVEEERRKEKA
ncbi:signal peptidase II [Cellulosilyticum ruminicola]|uniref:signal peptidase II n=1 Tax=Cellulosilyticum ruminicola TaxID=425254 RepID=UPI0006CF3260|nr:signal peptidase II [Cellulosilyticum ruminicola]